MESTSLAIANIVAIIFSAVIAVVITLWWQQRKEKRDAKLRLFTTLMAFRKSYPISYEWANALNLIDVVFSDSPTVVVHWHQYYAMLLEKSPNFEARTHKYLEMLSAMAHALGYQHMQQTDIDKFYIPDAHGLQADLNYKIQKEWLRVLENTAKFHVKPRDESTIVEDGKPPQLPPSQ